MRENEPQEVLHEWLCLNVEVPELLIAVPVANQLGDVSVYS